MNLKSIDPGNFRVTINDLWLNKWLLLTCGDYSASDFNAMTIAWGSMGIMWNKPFVQVVVRHSRYTFEFMERFDSFTVSAFPEKYRPALKLLGTKSGRDEDKITAAGLTPISSSSVKSPTFAEAELIICCKKIFQNEMDPAGFIDETIAGHYPEKEYHKIYFGEIVEISGIEAYS